MTIERKVGMGIAGQPSGATDVEKVFSTHLYTGNSNVGSVVNDIDLSGKGGMVWIRARNYADNHVIMDTERGGTKWIGSNRISGEATASNLITSFNSDGFTRGNNGSISDAHNFVSWTFGKKKKFFDVVTWSGNNSTNRQIPHSLGGPVGMIILKCISHSTNWDVFHTSLGNTKRMLLNRNDIAVQTSQEYWNNTSPTSANFTVGGSGNNNSTGRNYVAYVFADNSSEDAEEQMIKCGSYVGNQNATGPVVNLGWEPQWLMVKQTNLIVDPADWIMVDNMRGWATGASDARLYANTAGAENSTEIGIDITSTGFKLTTNGEQTNKNNATYIYMAIRAPMMVEPEAATDVFAMSTTSGGVIHNVGLVPDMAIWTNAPYSGQNRQIGSRLTGESYLRTNTNTVESNANQGWDEKNGYWQNPNHGSNINLLWKRAKGFFDVVCYNGSGNAGNIINGYHTHTIPHNLGVIPELVFVKNRKTNNQPWQVASPLGNGFLSLYDAEPYNTNVSRFRNKHLWSTTTWNVVGAGNVVNATNSEYIAYLFATLDGISKVGSYTGNGSSQTINCGFSAGARFVLIKRTNATGNWMVFDTARGIVAGDDPYFYLDSTSAHITDEDAVDPHSSGFIINQTNGDQNVSGSTYIFYAIA